MTTPLHVLILEDSQSDALLLLRELRRGGFEVTHRIIDNAADLEAALEVAHWDIILSDYQMPGFDAPAALQILKAKQLDIPVIVISGAMGEDIAVAAMKAGATDFFTKDKLSRVVPAVERELREATGRRKQHEAEARFAAAFHASPVGIVISRVSDGAAIDVNARFLEIFNYSREDIIGTRSTELNLWANPEQRRQYLAHLRKAGTVRNIEIEVWKKGGVLAYALASAELIHLDDEPCILTMIHDITDKKQAETALRASEEKFRLLSENSTDMISRHTPTGDYLYVSPACQTLLGYEPEEMLGRSAYEFFHPDDLMAVTKSHQTILTQSGMYTVEYRIRHKNGNYLWFETTSRTIRDSKTGELLEIQSASREISQRKEAEQSLKRYTERLELLHEIDWAILRGDNPQTTVHTVLERLQSLMGVHSASVTTFDLELRRFTLLATTVPTPRLPLGTSLPIENLSVIEILKQNEIYIVDDLPNLVPITTSEKDLIKAGICSYARIPLISKGKLIGAANFHAQETHAFSLYDLDIAKEAAAQLAIAIENARLLEVEQRSNSELIALHQASLHLTNTLDVQNVLDMILNYGTSLIQAADAHIFLYDGKTLTFGAAQREGQKHDAPYAEPRQDGLTYTVARSGERLVIPNVDVHPIYKDWPWGGAIIGLPLRVADQVNGVMSLAFTKPHHFDEHEIRLLELLADQAAIAIHNAQLYQQIKSHAQDLEQRVLERTIELQASEEDLRAALAKERELNELKTRFVSMVSHDFRTPLTIIQSSSNLLQDYYDHLDEEKRSRHFYRIHTQIQRMVDLLDDVLAFSRADAGAGVLNASLVNLEQFCRSIADDFYNDDSKKLVYTYAGEASSVQVDEKLLQQALINLLANAFKYSPEDSPVYFDVTVAEDSAVVRVKDSGIGIPKADQSRLFEMFHRASNVGSIEGTGLGLAIVKRSVEAHGGTIDFESVEGKGTEFIIRLPRE